MCQSFSSRSRKGFTLVELAVVIVIIGVLAAFGVPRFLVSVERSKAAEAFAYLSAVRDSQERYQAQNGTYASELTTLDITQSAPTYFTVGTCRQPIRTWTCTLTRQACVGRLRRVHRHLHPDTATTRQQHDPGHDQSHGD